MKTTMFPALASLAIAGSLLLAGGASAQDAPLGEEAPEREREECWCLEAPGRAFSFAFPGLRRARLGVLLGEPLRDGVEIESVVEGGPAERAGLRAGDVITGLDGASLGDGDGSASTRLLRLMQDVEPGDTVRVAYRRDGRSATAAVVTDRAQPGLARAAPRAPGAMPAPPPLPRVFGFDGDEHPGAVVLGRRFGSAGLSLVTVNPGLGAYFGVDAGVLVTEVDDDARLPLRPGDVILRIGGRDVRSARHVHRILASYDADEQVEIEIVRNRERQTVRGPAR